MKLLQYILGRLTIVTVTFKANHTRDVQIYLWTPNGLACHKSCDTAKRSITILAICGYGIITKSDDSPIISRVKENPRTFIWTSNNGSTCFIRQTQINDTIEELTAQGLIPARIFCIDTDKFSDKVVEDMILQFIKEIHWRLFIQITPEASAIVQHIVKRIAPTLLCFTLCLLCANYILAPRLNAKYQSLQQTLKTREQLVSSTISVNAYREKLLADFFAQPYISRAYICDQIAATTPLHISLTKLIIEPLTKRIEANQSLNCMENTVIMYGSASSASDVSTFVRHLSELFFFQNVLLKNIDNQKNTSLLTFRIEATL